MKRRRLIKGLAASFVVSPWSWGSGRAAQSEGQQTGDKTVELLFVQSARGVELKDGVLKLSGVNPATIFFSDRPERIVGHEPTEIFVAQWGVEENSFADNPPNAAISILAGPEPQEIILELMNPRLEENDLSYDVKVLDGKETASGDAVSLFIDPIGRPMSPGSAAGVHRRRRRHVVRRAVR